MLDMSAAGAALADSAPESGPADEERRRVATIVRALGDPKRLCVLESLAEAELSVSELSACVGCHVPNMSQHLAVLRSAGLVTTRREGSTVFYRLTDPRVLEAYRLIQDIARQGARKGKRIPWRRSGSRPTRISRSSSSSRSARSWSTSGRPGV